MCAVVGLITITDPRDHAAYAERTEALARPFGGPFLVRGRARTVIDGKVPTGTSSSNIPTARPRSRVTSPLRAAVSCRWPFPRRTGTW